MKLYDLAGSEDNRRTSPFCWRIRLALAYKGIAFNAVPWRGVEKDTIAFTGQRQVILLLRTLCAGTTRNIPRQLTLKFPGRCLYLLMAIQPLLTHGGLLST